jgi:aryl-alcohol dehydrogenase
MAIRARAAVVRQRGGPFVFEEVRIDDPRPDEVLVRIVACGICHTDIAGRDGSLGMWFPAVFGHEGAGVVERVGSGVARVRPGDNVVLSFSSCGECAGCREGHPARCGQFDELNFGGARSDGSPTVRDARGGPMGSSFFGQSSLAEYALARERSLVPVDVGGEDELAVLSPLGCGLQAGAGTVLNELKPRPGESVAVFGAGAVGLAALMAARMAGAAPIVAVDIVESRLELARELGASAVIDGRREDVGARLREVAGDVDHAVETTGVSRVIDQAVRSLGLRGKVSMLAVAADEGQERVSPKSPAPGQTSIYSIAGDSDPQSFIPFLVQSFREGRFPFDRLIRQYPASEINEAVEDSLAGVTIKPVLRF